MRRPDAQRCAEHEREADRVEERRGGEDHRTLVEGPGGAEGADPCSAAAARLPCVRRTPLGRPPVPLENGTAARSSGSSAGSAYGSPAPSARSASIGVASPASPPTTASIDVVEAGAVQRGANGPARGAKTIASPGHGAREHARRLVGRPQRAQRGDRGARAPHAQRDHRPPRQVGHGDRDQVARPHAARAQPGREGGRARGQLAARQRLAGGAVDDREGARIGGGVAQRRRWPPTGSVGGAGQRAAMDGRGHGASCDCPPGHFGTPFRNAIT